MLCCAANYIAFVAESSYGAITVHRCRPSVVVSPFALHLPSYRSGEVADCVRGKLATSPRREGAKPPLDECLRTDGGRTGWLLRAAVIGCRGTPDQRQMARDMASCVHYLDMRLANRPEPEWLIQSCELVLHNMTSTLVLVL